MSGSIYHGLGARRSPAVPAERPEPAFDTSGNRPPGRKRDGFDPSAHTVAEVLAYLAEHPDEAEAVLAAEATGKGRTSILNAR